MKYTSIAKICLFVLLCSMSVFAQDTPTQDPIGVIIAGESYICGEDDGVCPQDYETAEIDIICPAIMPDPDCAGSIRVLTQQGETVNVVEGVQATQGDIEVLGQQQIGNTTYATFKVSNGAGGSTATLDFGYELINVRVSFDGIPIGRCGVSPVPCYQHVDDQITVSYTLSTHLITVEFDTVGFSFGLFLLVIMGIAVPIVLIQYVRTGHLQHVHLHLGSMKFGVHKPHKDYASLEHYIEHSLSQGHNIDQIQDHLREKGWSQSAIDIAVHKLHKDHKDIKALASYITHAVEKGLSKREIYANLEKAGWTKKQIDEVYKKV